MALKIFFWISVAVFSLNIAGASVNLVLFALNKMNDAPIESLIFGVMDLIAEAIILLAVFGYVYKKAIFKIMFWEVSSIIVVFYTVSFDQNIFMFNELDIVKILTTLWIVMSFCLIFLYAFKSDSIWQQYK